MAIQRSVQQQVAETRAQIERAVSTGVAMPEWLRSALQEHALLQQSGLLVRYGETPEQEGTLKAGLWLTDSLEFWQFKVLVSRSSPQTHHVEEFINVTASFPAIAAQPGTGPSFGYLASLVLHETRDA